MRPVLHATGQHFAFARPTCAVLTAIGQANPLADAGGQQGLIMLSAELATTGLNRDGKSACCREVLAHLGYPSWVLCRKPSILPSNQSPLGALPSRFRRQRILVIGCGDVGLRVVRTVGARVQWRALTSSPDRVSAFRDSGVLPLQGNLDRPATLRRLAGLADRVLYLAPPPSEGWTDPRMAAMTRVLRLRQPPQALVYASTTGVYGDCQGQWVTEGRALAPQTPRAQRRVHAELVARVWGRATGTPASIVRIPGIYAPDRTGGTPRTRLEKGTPVLQAEDDVYTNHIHADDLAAACWRALWRGAPQRVYNVSDDTRLKMGDYFDLAADLYGLPRPPRVPRGAAVEQLPVMLLSFMSESRRMDNSRMKSELGVRLRYPDVATGLVSPSGTP